MFKHCEHRSAALYKTESITKIGSLKAPVTPKFGKKDDMKSDDTSPENAFMHSRNQPSVDIGDDNYFMPMEISSPFTPKPDWCPCESPSQVADFEAQRAWVYEKDILDVIGMSS